MVIFVNGVLPFGGKRPPWRSVEEIGQNAQRDIKAFVDEFDRERDT